ncbi:hypothetical protein ACH51_08130 [Ralstonia solanacearum]|nr:hypothetical protein ACH51_08130 [Ralstonia solanacearum]
MSERSHLLMVVWPMPDFFASWFWLRTLEDAAIRLARFSARMTRAGFRAGLMSIFLLIRLVMWC